MSRSRCSTCGIDYSTDNVGECPRCYKLYQEDLAEGRIPPGITKENFRFCDWVRTKELLRGAQIHHLTDEQTRETIEFEMSRVNAMLEKEKSGQAEAERQRKMQERIEEVRNLGRNIY